MGRKARSVCMPELALNSPVPARTQFYAESVASRLRVLKIAAWISAAISLAFGIFQLTLGGHIWWIGLLNIVFAAVFAAVPLLYRFGELIAPLTFFVFAYLFVGFVCYTLGTGSGLQFYYLVSATLVVLVFGVERIALVCTIVTIGVAATIALELFVPRDRGLGPHWSLTVGFISSAVFSAVMVVATVFYAMREIERGRDAIQEFFQQSSFPELATKSSELAFLEEWLEEVSSKRPLSKLEIMQREMEVAIASELYERAAELRDAIKMLQAGK